MSDASATASSSTSYESTTVPIVAEISIEADDSSKVVIYSSSSNSSVASASSTASAAYAFESVVGDPIWQSNRELKDKWLKWNLDAGSTYGVFRFDKKFETEEGSSFLHDFFESPAVVPLLNRGAGCGCLTPTITRINYESVPSIVTTMSFFDVLLGTKAIVVHPESGRLRGKFEETIEGVVVGDTLRDTLLNPDAELPLSDLYTAADGREFLFQLFRLISLGGSMSQYEESILPYLSATKDIYKSLLSVGREGGGGGAPRIAVRSIIYHVSGISSVGDAQTEEASSASLFKHYNPHNRCWVIVDPAQRLCRVWRQAWTPFW